jgi:hypothetical protein
MTRSFVAKARQGIMLGIDKEPRADRRHDNFHPLPYAGQARGGRATREGEPSRRAK